MTLQELKEQVDNAIEMANEAEEPINEIQVSIQIDLEGGDSIWSDEDLELHYDNNGMVSGCVLNGFANRNTPDPRK